MKLATYKDGSRDGQLVVVSRDLCTAHYATGMAQTMRQALDDWNFIAPQLQDLYVTLNQGKARHAFPFEPRRCAAPLPRTGLWAQALAFAEHRERVWPGVPADPVPLRLAGGDHLTGPHDDCVLGQDAWEADVGPMVTVVTDDIPQGADAARALDGVRLLALANAWELRLWEPAEEARGWLRAPNQPAVAFAPVAVTPDELGDAWRDGRLHLPVRVLVNGALLGRADAGGMAPDFGAVLARLCATRPLRNGSLVGAGPVSGGEGWGCLAERRAVEAAQQGQPLTPYLGHGGRVAVEVTGRDGQSVFGAIEQEVVPLD